MLRGVLKYDPGETDLGFNLSQQVTTPVVCERTAKVRVWCFIRQSSALFF